MIKMIICVRLNRILKDDRIIGVIVKNGATGEVLTLYRVIGNRMLYQLSYGCIILKNGAPSWI
jgi:hypothetical protein